MGKTNKPRNQASLEADAVTKADTASIDLNYRPTTYWPEETTTDTELRQLREAAAGRAGHPLGQFEHNFLPDNYPGEVEIARLDLESTTGDVISIRARQRKNSILFRVASEYEDGDSEFAMNTSRKSAKQPLTLRQLIGLIDNIREGNDPATPTDFRNRNWDVASATEEDLEQLASFVSVTSTFYRDLTTWYAADAELWLSKAIKWKQGSSGALSRDVRNTFDEVRELLANA